MRIVSWIGLVVLALGTAGCMSDTTVGDDLGTAGGRLTAASGHTVPDGADVYVIWTVSAGSSDYRYAFGNGSVDGSRFFVTLDTPPPAEALNRGLGVGTLVLVDEGTAISEGILDDTAEAELESAVLGLATDHAVIYRAPDSEGYREWEVMFPEGEYSCGDFVPAAAGETFGSFVPMDCGEFEIRIDDPDNLEIFNWT